MKNNIIKVRYLLTLVAIGVAFASCSKFVETDPPTTQTSGGNVYNNDATAIAVLTGIYSGIYQGSPSPNFATGTRSFSLLCGLSADEYTLYTGANAEMTAFYKNALISNSASPTNLGSDYWNSLYDNLYSANSAIEGLNNSQGLTLTVKQQLLGEAKFMRAFVYFYLVNLFGDIPLVTTTDYTLNKTLSRSPKATVYQQIISDLKDAEDLLSTDYLDGRLQKYTSTPERTRPTKGAAAALLARVYLYNGNLTGDASNYVNAEAQATSMIGNVSLYDTTSLNNVFLKNSREAIWQLQPTKSNQNTDDSRMFILTSLSSSMPVWLSDTLLNSFENGDLRKVNGNWVNSTIISSTKYYYPYKYKNNTATVSEYLMVLRLAEQYLIRAEARALQNNLPGAIADLDIIRKRAGLPLIANTNPGISQSALLDKIFHERQVEFFSEWGHRWFDLKRTNTVDALMTVITPRKANGEPWRSYQKYYPIPFSELQNGINLTQTPGYQ